MIYSFIGSKNIVNLLINWGADVNHTDNSGNSALLAAIKEGTATFFLFQRVKTMI